MRNFPATDTAALPRISQIDCLPQNRVDPEEFEQARRKQKIDDHKKEIMSQAAALKVQRYGRKRADHTSGALPPISQISMGGRQMTAAGNSAPEEGLKLPPISQVSCLGGYVDERNLLIKPSKSRVRDSDSDFIKLSKAGGQRDLLCYKEAPASSREDETDANAHPRSTRYVPGFTTEADPRWRPSHWSDFTRQRAIRHGDTRLIWR